MPILYLLLVKFTELLLPAIAFFSKNKKLKLFIDGRHHLLDNLKLAAHPNRFWFHCASLGEFEQARPVIENIKNKQPASSIVISFFSPSGYEQKKNYNLADAVIYLPLDTPSNARRLVEIIQPKAVIFVKYEIWYFYLKALFKRNIPVYLISANFRKNQAIFNVFGKWLFNLLPQYRQIFLQDEKAFQLLKSKKLTNITLSGDTRFDRVIQNAQNTESNNKIERFKGQNRLIILGSSWPKEEDILKQYLESKSEEPMDSNDNSRRNYRIIIAPHDIGLRHIAEIQEKFKTWQPLLYSEYDVKSESNLMILNTMGNLASAYKYADIAFIGGGFTGQLHNILEPLAFGVPVMTGPVHHKFPEAEQAKKAGVLFEITDAETFKNTLSDIENAALSNKAELFIHNKSGATAVVSDFILN